MVGFIQNTKTNKWQCAYAKQTKKSKVEKSMDITKNAAFIEKAKGRLTQKHTLA